MRTIDLASMALRAYQGGGASGPRRVIDRNDLGDVVYLDYIDDGLMVVHAKLAHGCDAVMLSARALMQALHPNDGEISRNIPNGQVQIACRAEFRMREDGNIELLENRSDAAVLGDVIRLPRPSLAGCWSATTLAIGQHVAQYWQKHLAPFDNPVCCSDWLLILGVSDIWSHIVDGGVWCPNAGRGAAFRFQSQQCARALFQIAQAANLNSPSPLALGIAAELALCTAHGMAKRGYIEHNLWSISDEIHARFQYDAISLLCDAYVAFGAEFFIETAQVAFSFVLEHLLDDQEEMCWFLHDTKEDHIQPALFTSHAFGKGPGNSLTLNTHLQATAMLVRHEERLVGRGSQLFDRALASFLKVIECQPPKSASLLEQYFQEVEPYWKCPDPGSNLGSQSPVEVARFVSHGSDVSLSRSLLNTRCLELKQRCGLMRWPSGLIERDLTLSIRNIKYHVTNAKDILLLLEAAGARIGSANARLRRFADASLAVFDLIDPNKALQLSHYFLEVLDCGLIYADIFGQSPPFDIRAWWAAIEVRGSVPIEWFARGGRTSASAAALFDPA